MHNVNTDALSQTIQEATANPAMVKQHVSFDGEWQTEPGAVQFRATIPVPSGDPVVFAADFPPPMGGSGSAPNPLAYCFWGGLACYAMTFAQEAARRGIQLRSLRARVETDVDMSRALGITHHPPVERIDWHLDVDADTPRATLDELKSAADEHCPGVYCIRNPIYLSTHLNTSGHTPARSS